VGACYTFQSINRLRIMARRWAHSDVEDRQTSTQSKQSAKFDKPLQNWGQCHHGDR